MSSGGKREGAGRKHTKKFPKKIIILITNEEKEKVQILKKEHKVNISNYLREKLDELFKKYL